MSGIDPPHYDILKVFFSSAVAGATSRCCTAPLDRLKIILQTQQSVGTQKKYQGLLKSFVMIFNEDGLRGYWRGNGANVLKVIPEIGSRYLFFENLKTYIMKSKNSTELTTLERFLSGGGSGVLSQFLVYPMEVIRSRLVVSEKRVYNGIIDCTIKTYKSGFTNFYRGLTPSILGIFPYAAVDLSIYDLLRTYYIKKYDDTPTPLFSLMTGAISSCCGIIEI
eukprot:TRINITY_DN4404_c0_g1_i1.p1 TRINITY_DN4404_c0_g1~~TRINITY_DN4404_c0_g1_i1.p1  ORF type:complete len:222 (+),score=31.36 TRINITY_DN4404_c0_g1_i1:17-682(+)